MDLRLLFEQALADEPSAAPADFAGRAMAIGRRQRRRRTIVVGGTGAAVIAALGVANLLAPTPVETVPARFASLVNPLCESPAGDTATDLSVFLTADVTDRQRAAVNELLQHDPAAGTVRYESRDQAYAQFKALFSDAPALVTGVDASELPESFRVKLVDGAQADRVANKAKNAPGVDDVINSRCPDGADVTAAG
ncbi:permease-like cell division protein FtsX [Asanoa sp. NPDC050611]|uniref:permease-like cell division protein FtsX n=1 Tax=Asanoa sp. NPDC050611 TaxID=3157098 RepID=UPI003403ECCB